MAELFGKTAGASAGKGGSMHLFGAEQAFMGGQLKATGDIMLAQRIEQLFPL